MPNLFVPDWVEIFADCTQLGPFLSKENDVEKVKEKVKLLEKVDKYFKAIKEAFRDEKFNKLV